jgi:hypothetical protein
LRTEAKLKVRVSHFPPGTSKWNKIEHRLFCHITQNWRGKPLRTFETIVDLIRQYPNRQGPARQRQARPAEVQPTGVKVSKAEMRELDLRPHSFHGEWNYVLQPRDLTR